MNCMTAHLAVPFRNEVPELALEDDAAKDGDGSNAVAQRRQAGIGDQG